MDKRESVLIVPVPESEDLVSEIRNEYDPAVRKKIPAHITLLFPFIPPEKIKFEDVEKLRNILSIKKFEFTLSRVNTFPGGVVFIEPKEKELFVDLINKLFAEFPEYPPFEGKFLPEIHPHLTIGNNLGERFEDCLKKAKEIESELPLKCQVKEIFLMTSENNIWSIKEIFELL